MLAVHHRDGLDTGGEGGVCIYQLALDIYLYIMWPHLQFSLCVLALTALPIIDNTAASVYSQIDQSYFISHANGIGPG